MATRILWNSVNLLSTKLSKPTSKFGCLSFSRKWRMVVTSDLQQQQQQQSVNNINNKLTLLVGHGDLKGSRKFTLLSTQDNSLRSMPNPLTNCPFASSNHELLLCHSEGGLTLWNPATDEDKILPQSSVPRPPSVEDEFDLYYGFGFDPKSLQPNYKVVRFVCYRFEDGSEPDDLFQVELYSLKTDSWKEISIPPNIGDMPSGSSKHINGFNYWVAYKNRGYVIIRFDFANDNFSPSNIPLPQTDKITDGYLSNYILVEFEGSLAVVAYSLADELAVDEKPFEFEIWVWNDDDESWTRKRVCQIIIPAGSPGIGSPRGLFKIDKLYLEDFMREMVLFDCGNGRLTNTGLKSDSWISIYPYIESSAEEEVKHREIISNSNTSKLAPIVIDSKQKHNNNNKLKLLIDHEYEGNRYFSGLSANNFSKDDDDDDNNVLFNFPSLGSYFRPAESCNNALLLCDVGNRGAALWNPTTDDVKKLPDVVLPSLRNYISCYGFGFDPKQAAASQDYDYKVIRFVEKTDRPRTYQVELYSLKNDSWKDITSLYPDHSECPKYGSSIHINGVSYWLAPLYAEFIISFDFADEKFSSPPHIPLPPTPQRRKLLLAEFNGSLAALVYTNCHQYFSNSCCFTLSGEREKPFELEIWVWNNDESSSSWAKVSTIHVPDIDIEKPLGLIGNDQLYLKASNGELLLYDYAKGGELKNLGVKATHIFSYLESSFPLNGKKLIRADYKIIND